MAPPCPLVPPGGGPAVIARGLVPHAVARSVSSTVPSACALGIVPPAPLAGGPMGGIIGGHPLLREGMAASVDPPQSSAPLADKSSQTAQRRLRAHLVCPISCISRRICEPPTVFQRSLRVSNDHGVCDPCPRIP